MKKIITIILKSLLLFFISTLIVFLVGCNKDDSQTNIKPFPWLKIGNEWTYERTDWTSADGHIVTDTNFLRIIDVEVQSDDIDLYITQNKNGDTRPTFWYHKVDKALLVGIDSPIMYWNSYTGHTWNVDEFHIEVVSTSSMIYVPAGTFSCVKIKISKNNGWADELPNVEWSVFINKAHGLIKREKIEQWKNADNNEIQQSISTTILLSKNF